MKYIIKNKHWNIAEDYNLDKVLYLLIDRPDNIFWRNNKNERHRDYDLPAVAYNDGYVEWFQNHKRHRENNKPAIVCDDFTKEYYINGDFC